MAASRATSRVVAAAATGAPTLVFLAANAVGGLLSASVAAAVTAVVVLAWRLRARQQVRYAVVGALLATACAAVAAWTGQARGFFLLPMVIPAAATAACLLSVAAGRPLAGLIANRIVGGPPEWRSHRALHRFYAVTTVVIGLVSLVSLAAQVALYRWGEVAWLGVLHLLMGPLWAAITALSVLLSRITVTRARNAARETARHPVLAAAKPDHGTP
ncbi:DUF3159 domain-containing protein [Streptantibioticus cattleyicolor]|uniref:DUF3159 domain-containing protein n=1 Tax=Streptantibioticus cattleyicolor TaxID=29303 RepID=UPI000AD8E52E|nr:DUF3159 domain-containing protein [Streptantibioticus cattleyicolor]